MPEIAKMLFNLQNSDKIKYFDFLYSDEIPENKTFDFKNKQYKNI